MDSAKLLIIGGVVLGGIYLLDKNKKDKENAQALALANSQAQPQLQLEVETKPTIPTVNSKALLTPKEATVYATRTIADVNALIVKYPALKKDEFLKNYNSVYKTNLFLENNGNITAPKISQEEIDAQLMSNIQQTDSATYSGGSKWGGLVSQARALELAVTNSEFRVSDANRVFNDTQMGYTRWKSDFSTVYSDLKNYFSTLTKEQADLLIKYLPKMIIQALMGDNDPRARANDFYSQEEIIDMVDNNLKEFDGILSNALKGFFNNLRAFNGFGNVKTVSGTGLEAFNAYNIKLQNERELAWKAKMNEIALSEKR